MSMPKTMLEIAPYDMSIHSNSSALAWTQFFRECRPECNIDDEIMLGWFANAMMAMCDHIHQTSPPRREPLSEEAVKKFADAEYMVCNNAFTQGVRWAEQQHKIGVGDE